MTTIGRDGPIPKSSSFGFVISVRCLDDCLPLVPSGVVYREPETLSILGRPFAKLARYWWRGDAFAFALLAAGLGEDELLRDTAALEAADEAVPSVPVAAVAAALELPRRKNDMVSLDARM